MELPQTGYTQSDLWVANVAVNNYIQCFYNVLLNLNIVLSTTSIILTRWDWSKVKNVRIIYNPDNRGFIHSGIATGTRMHVPIIGVLHCISMQQVS